MITAFAKKSVKGYSVRLMCLLSIEPFFVTPFSVCGLVDCGFLSYPGGLVQHREICVKYFLLSSLIFLSFFKILLLIYTMVDC